MDFNIILLNGIHKLTLILGAFNKMKDTKYNTVTIVNVNDRYDNIIQLFNNDR